MSVDTPTGDRPKTYIKLPDPRRTWLIHCADAYQDLGVCVIAVERGSVVIYAPDGSESFELSTIHIAEFRAAFAEAIQVAESDLRARAAASVPAPS